MPGTFMLNGYECDMIEVPNPEVLKAAVKHIEDNIALWNQSDWARLGDRLPDEKGGCGTSACLAGHILLSQGTDWKTLVSDETDDSIARKALNALGFDWTGSDSDRERFEDQIFMFTHDYEDETWDDNVLAYTPEKLAAFKAYVTLVTGVTFDE